MNIFFPILHWSCMGFDINLLLVGSDKRLSSRHCWDLLVLRLLSAWCVPRVDGGGSG
jgi:hypothetical protein